VLSEIVKEIILCEPRYPDNFLRYVHAATKLTIANAGYSSPAAAIKVVPFRGIKEQSAKSLAARG